jgi:hypothetical protein
VRCGHVAQPRVAEGLLGCGPLVRVERQQSLEEIFACVVCVCGGACAVVRVR